MPGDVGQCLLGDAEERLFDFEGRFALALNAEVGGDLGPFRPAGDVLAQRGCEALSFQGGGAHLLDQDVQLFLGLAHQLVGLGEVGLGGFGVLLDQGAGCGDLERGSEDLLLDGVVKVAGEAVAGL